MFESAILTTDPSPRRRWTMPASLLLQAAVVSTLVVMPLVFNEQLGLAQLRPLSIAVPFMQPKAPEVHAASTAMARPSPRLFRDNRLIARPAIPDKIALIDDFPVTNPVGPYDPNAFSRFASNSTIGVFDPNAIPGPPPPKPAPVAATPKPPAGPVHIGGDVKAPTLIRQVQPIYPPLARTARVEGTVRINAILTRDH